MGLLEGLLFNILNSQLSVIAKRYGVADSLDPLQNLRGGARYLRYLLKKNNNDNNLALATYNAGKTC